MVMKIYCFVLTETFSLYIITSSYRLDIINKLQNYTYSIDGKDSVKETPRAKYLLRAVSPTVLSTEIPSRLTDGKLLIKFSLFFLIVS